MSRQCLFTGTPSLELLHERTLVYEQTNDSFLKLWYLRVSGFHHAHRTRKIKFTFDDDNGDESGVEVPLYNGDRQLLLPDLPIFSDNMRVYAQVWPPFGSAWVFSQDPKETVQLKDGQLCGIDSLLIESIQEDASPFLIVVSDANRAAETDLSISKGKSGCIEVYREQHSGDTLFEVLQPGFGLQVTALHVNVKTGVFLNGTVYNLPE